jgi:indolepyruvate ferredoxin oxidoreductase
MNNFETQIELSDKVRKELAPDIDMDYQLSDSLVRTSGRVLITGTQALVRLLLEQKQLDVARGLDTAGFVSGYRGSPLGALDLELWRAAGLLKGNRIEFLPAVNEELAATAVLGSQQVESNRHQEVTGVFAMWYGKGPGVDRAGDAFKHGNAYGSSPHGGVLLILGDDHGCVSSSMPHQSEQALMASSIPVINPANIAEYIEFGLNGWAMSRYSGAWVGFKAISETVEGCSVIDIGPMPSFQVPDQHGLPPSGLHYRWPDFPSLSIEARVAAKLDAVRAFAKVNPIDKFIVRAPKARVGIIAVGKAYLDLLEAFKDFDIGIKELDDLCIRLYKPGLTYPLETTRIDAFAEGLEAILVVEEKAPVVEQQIKNLLFNRPDADRPRVWGKTDGTGAPLLPATGELRPSRITSGLTHFLKHFHVLNISDLLVRASTPRAAVPREVTAKRTPYFCSGCPHNISTRVPDGSRALAGVGCHFMASWMDRDTGSLTQMGGEGVNWSGASRFLKQKHIFQNLGDGTYYHSGHLAVRQAVAAHSHITFKILYNDAVAMTGGQPIDGSLSVLQIVQQVLSEGVKKVIVVTDNPEKYAADDLPSHVPVRHRRELDAVQRQLREIEGVTVLIYDQVCAAEKRRRLKRDKAGRGQELQKRMYIHPGVCEGCGDCGVQSNCLSIQPLDTELGRKRKINQSSCNTDYSCADGFCPSFVTIYGGEPKKAETTEVSIARLEKLLAKYRVPEACFLERPYQLLIAGIGGTGVVTVSSIIATAAHLEGKNASTLDFMGFAQKGGAVISHVRIADALTVLNQARIDVGQADAVLACDLVVAMSDDAFSTIQEGVTRIVANSHVAPTADFVRNPDAVLDPESLMRNFSIGDEVFALDAQKIAERVLGDATPVNVLIMGYAWQKGLIPISSAALMRAIELHHKAVELNKKAFLLGRLAAADNAEVSSLRESNIVQFSPPESLDEIVEFRKKWLANYQNAAYAERYVRIVQRIEEKEVELEGAGSKRALAKTVARTLFKVMAYKDEYEIARLYSDPDFHGELKKQFSGPFKLAFNFAPPLISKLTGNTDAPKKMELGSWILPFLKMLAGFKFLRGTVFDPFGYTRERKEERDLRDGYIRWLDSLVPIVTSQNKPVMLQLARLPDQVRGFGHIKRENLRKMYVERGKLQELSDTR